MLSMEFTIFNVTHGFCAYLVADNRNVMLFDCGHNETTGFRPSAYLKACGCTGIEHLVISNFDQDHISDLPNVINMFPIKVFYRNRSITADELTNLKLETGPLTDAMQTLVGLHREYIQDVPDPDFPDIEFRCFRNTYPTFADTNNLSLVAFVHYHGMGVVFPGDLETAGWQVLLKNSAFCDHLSRTNIFVASHHGRASGYCREVFNYCSPDIVIISDKEIVHETQKNSYKDHATGVVWNGGPQRRYVLTTRSDGMITINKTLGSDYYISASS